MKFAWIDLRTVPRNKLESVVDAAIHTRMRGVLCDDETVLKALPGTITGVTTTPVTDEKQLYGLDADTAGWVDVHDEPSLRLACAAAVTLPFTVVRFADPTKIPLEIVLAAADRSEGKLITVCADLEEAATVLDVLERGSDGILLAPSDAGEVFALARLLEAGTAPLNLTTLTVDGIEHHGLGDRVCVDTCSHFAEDEGILVGSFSTGFILCCSETHPL